MSRATPYQPLLLRLLHGINALIAILGSKRLIQPDSFQRLSQLGKPIGWYSLHRIVNTVMLLAITFSYPLTIIQSLLLAGLAESAQSRLKLP